ncbi:hypothetical protein [Massilia yuzhufengensis]|uniref:hypothetical protein n=1 Tax=Massilia yuzhufengensis TaxID=1164594 RepID=UPI001160D287|nr:hypothetical protein [Massilia yuzhufengensis]
MSQTVPLQGCIYDLGSEEAVQVAAAWIANHPGDVADFAHEFPGAQVVASIGGHHLQPPGPCYHVFGSASNRGNGWIPSARVVFAHPDGKTGTALRDLPQLGRFPTAGEAQNAARKAKVAEIRPNGAVVFECEQS